MATRTLFTTDCKANTFARIVTLLGRELLLELKQTPGNISANVVLEQKTIN